MAIEYLAAHGHSNVWNYTPRRTFNLYAHALERERRNRYALFRIMTAAARGDEKMLTEIEQNLAD